MATTTSPHRTIHTNEIQTTLRRIEDADIEYCIRRNYEFLDGGAITDDIDLLVAPDQQEAFEAVMHDCGYVTVSGGSTRHTFYRKYLRESREVIRIDVAWGGTGYNGIPLVDSERVLQRRERYNGAWVPSDEDYFVQITFHGALNKGRYRDSYRNDLERLRSEVDEEIVRSHAESLFGELGVTAVEHALDGEFGRVVDLKWRLVLHGATRSITNALVLFWNLILYHQLVLGMQSLNQRWNPFGGTAFVAVLGPDGVGKTTCVRTVEKELSANGIEAETRQLGVYNGESIVMRLLKRIRNRLVGWDREAQTRARRTGSMTIDEPKATWKAVIHLLDIVIRWLQANVGSAEVVVADRYVHDLYVHDRVGPLGPVIRWFERGLFRGVVLTTDPELIAERSEFDVESIEEMIRRMDAIEFERIDAEQGPDAVADDVLEHVLSDPRFLALA